jgi:hypothetical protein
MDDLKCTLAPKTFQHLEYEFNCARLDCLKKKRANKIRSKREYIVSNPVVKAVAPKAAEQRVSFLSKDEEEAS